MLSGALLQSELSFAPRGRSTSDEVGQAPSSMRRRMPSCVLDSTVLSSPIARPRSSRAASTVAPRLRATRARAKTGDASAPKLLGIWLASRVGSFRLHDRAVPRPALRGAGIRRRTRSGKPFTPSNCRSRGDLAGLQLAQPIEGTLQGIVPVTGHAAKRRLSRRSEIYDNTRRTVLSCWGAKSRKCSGSVLAKPRRKKEHRPY